MDLSILQEYRNRSEYLLKSTLRGTQAVSPEQVAFFEQDLESLKELRNRLDLELSKNIQSRDPFIADLLFAEISDLLSRIEDFLLSMIQAENDSLHRYTKMSLLRFYSFKLRNTIGREAFTITGALSGGNPWNAHKQTELARIDFLWLTIQNYVSDPDLNPADIKKAADEF